MPKANTNWGICEAGIHFPHELTTVEPGNLEILEFHKLLEIKISHLRICVIAICLPKYLFKQLLYPGAIRTQKKYLSICNFIAAEIPLMRSNKDLLSFIF